jgi:hypothetical protein
MTNQSPEPRDLRGAPERWRPAAVRQDTNIFTKYHGGEDARLASRRGRQRSFAYGVFGTSTQSVFTRVLSLPVLSTDTTS